MRRILVTMVAVAATVMPVLAQNKQNTLRVGAGVCAIRDSEVNLSVGPAFFAEYSREIMPRLAISVDIQMNQMGLKHKVDYNYHTAYKPSSTSQVGGDINLLLRPFVKVPVLNRLIFGVGGDLAYCWGITNYGVNRTLDGSEHFSVGEENKWYGGWNFPIRIVVIENEKLDLTAICNGRTIFNNKDGIHAHWKYYNFGVMLGVKF